MAQWTKIAVPLSGGLDTKTDSKVVLPTKMTVLENAEFTKGGSVKKRPGNTAIPLVTSGNVDIEDSLGLATHGRELAVLAKTNVYSYDDKTGKFQDAGEYCPMTWTAEAAVNGPSNQTKGDCATNEGVTVYAWEDSRGGVRYAVYNDETGAPYLADGVLDSSNAGKPKVVAVGNNIIITYADTGDNTVKAKLIRPGAIAASLAAVATELVSTLSSNSDYDVVGSAGGTGWVLYESTAGSTDLKLADFDSSATLGTTVVVTTADVDRPVALAYNETTGKLIVGYALSAAGDGIAAEYNASSLTVTGRSLTLTQSNTLIGISVWAGDDTSFGIWSTADNSSAYTTSWGYESAASAETTGTLLKATVATGAWSDGNTGYVILAYDSTTGLQDSYFLYRHDGVLCGRLFYREGNGNVRSSSAAYGPRVSAKGDGTYQCLLEYRRSLATDQGDAKNVVNVNAQYSSTGLRRVTLDPEPQTNAVEVGETAYLGGAMLWAYDGGPHPVESAPLLWPEILTSSISQTGAGSMVSGNTYNYRVYAEARLTNGQVVRSAAITRSFTTAATTKINIVIPCIPFTRHLGDRPNINFVVYRSENNKADLYYRISDPSPASSGDNAYVANDPTAATVTFLDNEPTDANIIDNELDYQCQGEIPHFAPDGTSFLGAAQSRLFLVGGGTKPNNVIPSLLRYDGEAVVFNDNLAISETPAYGGHVVGLAPLNDVVLVFKERSVFAVAGNGADNTGNNGFFETRAISADMGCQDPGSIVSLPIGVMFKSAKGFFLVTPEFELLYIGAEVEAYNAQTFVGAAPVPDSNQVIFIPTSGNAVVFDWFYKSWSTFTNHYGLDAVVWKEETFAFLRADGNVYLRDSSLYTDGGAPYALKIRTAPIRPEDLVQGFWLCGPVTVLGDYRSLHRLVVGVYYDRDEGPFEAFTVSPVSFVETEEFGDDTPYGDADFYGGDIASSEYQFAIKPRRSKCQTVRFEFTDIPGTDPGASYEITELALMVGLKDGTARLPASRKV